MVTRGRTAGLIDVLARGAPTLEHGYWKETRWLRPRSSDGSDSSFAPTSTHCSTAPRIPRRCSTSSCATSPTTSPKQRKQSPRRSATCASSRTKRGRTASSDWGDKAAAASRRADQLREEGNTAEADRFDQLAKIAIRRQLSYEGQATTLETQASQQAELAEKLKDGLNKLRAKREELVQKRDELVSRAKMAQAQEQVQVSLQSVSVLDPTSEISRFEEGIRRQEAMVRGREEVAASSLDEQFASLDDDEDEIEVETRLAQLKTGS